MILVKLIIGYVKGLEPFKHQDVYFARFSSKNKPFLKVHLLVHVLLFLIPLAKAQQRRFSGFENLHQMWVIHTQILKGGESVLFLSESIK